VALCWEAGIRHGLVNLGGDIKIIGPQPDGAPWAIGIRHPRQPGAFIKTLVSGAGRHGQQRRLRALHRGGWRPLRPWLNPRTGWPVAYLAAVSVVADLCVVAGSASTIAMLKEQAGPEWLRSMQAPHYWFDVSG
jgi:thiamine biosynthesis lipoprotein